VYVTANPHLQIVADNFHKVVDLVHDEDSWDEELGTVAPSVVAEAAVKAHETYPDKRLIVHFMQPHYPFIGPRGDQIDFDTKLVGHIPREEHETSDGWEAVKGTSLSNPWAELRDLDDAASQQVWDAYVGNLELVLSEVAPMLGEIGGKSVVTADHGNLIGEWILPLPVRGYGHPRDVHVPRLLKVPWHVIESETRREVVSEPQTDWEEPDPAVVEQRLKKLGYKG
jgi:hypothetical protein